MANVDTNALLAATAEILEATGKVVRAINPENGADKPGESLVPVVAPRAAATPQDLKRSDSPAWYDAHHPEGSKGVGALGTDYYNTHVAAVEDPQSPANHKWDPSRGATWKDFARIGQVLFAKDQIFDAKEALRDGDAFPYLRHLQKMFEYYDVSDPDKVIPAAFPWPNAGGFPTRNSAWTVREAISEYLAHLNRNPDGKPADRDADFSNAPAPVGALRLSHGQCVELYHLLRTQEDLRLVAPYNVLDKLVW